jgi:hypothetical protein
MARVLAERGLLNDDEADISEHALMLLALSAFYGKASFTRVIRLMALIWMVWEDNVDPEQVSQASQAHLLMDWTPPKGTKPQ